MGHICVVINQYSHWHIDPAKPRGQVHVNPRVLTLASQVPLFLHELGMHTLNAETYISTFNINLDCYLKKLSMLSTLNKFVIHYLIIGD